MSVDTFMGTPEASPPNEGLKLIDTIRNVDEYEKRLLALDEKEKIIRELVGAANTLEKANKVLAKAEKKNIESDETLEAANAEADAIVIDAKDRAKAADEVAGDNIKQAKKRNADAKVARDAANGKLAEATKVEKEANKLMAHAEHMNDKADKIRKDLNIKAKKLSTALKDI